MLIRSKENFHHLFKLLGRNKNKTLHYFPPDTLSSIVDDYYHQNLTSTLINLPPYTSLITPTLSNQSLKLCIVPSMSDIATFLNATKSHLLYLIPHSLLHEITESLTIPLNYIFCESLKSGTFPISKMAQYSQYLFY